MKRISLAPLLALLVALPCSAGAPRFEDFPASAAFSGKPAKVDLKSMPGARYFRTRLREGAAKGPNFAGDMTVIIWGCGSDCQSIAFVSARTGRIFDSLSGCGGAEFHLESTLLVVNPPDPERVLPEFCKTEYYQWTGRNLVPAKGH